MKSTPQTALSAAPQPGLHDFSTGIPGADAPGYYATAPIRGLRIWLAALAVFGRRNG